MALYSKNGALLDPRALRRRMTIGLLLFLVFGSFIFYSMFHYLRYRQDHRVLNTHERRQKHRDDKMAEALQHFGIATPSPKATKKKEDHHKDHDKKGGHEHDHHKKSDHKDDHKKDKHHEEEKKHHEEADPEEVVTQKPADKHEEDDQTRGGAAAAAGGKKYEPIERDTTKGVGPGVCRAKYGGEMGMLPNPYYNVKDIAQGAGDFDQQLEYLCRNINSTWKKHTWTAFDKVDISQCHIETPECGLWCEFCGTQPGKVFEDADRPYRKCCVEHKKLRDTAVWVMKQMDQAGLRYFLSTGSAIGAYRHHGTIIPWDTDVDLVVFPEDEEAVTALFKTSKEHYFQKDPQGKPMFWVHHSKNGKPAGGPHVEIFFQKDYTNHKKELLPLIPCDYYGKYNASCPQTTMLDVWFPSGWRSPNGCHYHSDGRATMYHQGKRQEKSKC